MSCSRRLDEDKGISPISSSGQHYFLLLGRPRGWSVNSRPNRFAVRACQASLPNGWPRVTALRSAASSAAVCGGLSE